MFALIGNAPELVHGARVPNCEYEAKNKPQLDCCKIYPSAYGCKKYQPEYSKNSFIDSQEQSQEGIREQSQEGIRQQSQEQRQEGSQEGSHEQRQEGSQEGI